VRLTEKAIAIYTVFAADVADDDDDGDSWMIDFWSNEFSDRRVHRTSSFLCSPSFAALDAGPFTTDYLSSTAPARPPAR